MENVKQRLIDALREIDKCYLEFCLPALSLESTSYQTDESVSTEDIISMATDIRSSLRKVFILIAKL